MDKVMTEMKEYFRDLAEILEMDNETTKTGELLNEVRKIKKQNQWISVPENALTKAKQFCKASVFFFDNHIIEQALDLLVEKNISAQHKSARKNFEGLIWFRDELNEAINEYQSQHKYLTDEMPLPPITEKE